MDYIVLAYISDANLGEDQDQDVPTKTRDLHWNAPCKEHIRTHVVAFGKSSWKSCQSTKTPKSKCREESRPLFCLEGNLTLNLQRWGGSMNLII